MTTDEPLIREVRPVGYVGPIPISEILDDPKDNIARGCVPVLVTPKLRRFAESLKSGQQQPVMVRPILDGSGAHRYRLVFGFRRIAAARLIGWREIDAKVIDATDAEARLRNWAEGNREDASVYETAVGVIRAHEMGVPSEQIAMLLGDFTAEEIDALILIMTKCPPEILEVFRVDCSPRTLRLLENIASIDAGSPSETRRLQLQIWSDERINDVERQRELAEAAKNPKPRKKWKRKYERKTLSTEEINQLEGRFATATEWFDPLDNEYRFLSDEMKAFGAMLIQSFKRGKISLR